MLDKPRRPCYDERSRETGLLKSTYLFVLAFLVDGVAEMQRLFLCNIAGKAYARKPSPQGKVAPQGSERVSKVGSNKLQDCLGEGNRPFMLPSMFVMSEFVMNYLRHPLRRASRATSP